MTFEQVHNLQNLIREKSTNIISQNKKLQPSYIRGYLDALEWCNFNIVSELYKEIGGICSPTSDSDMVKKDYVNEQYKNSQ